jgi:HlyD family secretion protein
MEQRRKIVILLLVVAALAGLGWFLYATFLAKEAPASGTIEVDEVVVSSKVIGRAIEVLVDEGAEVKVGDLLARIETQELAAALKSAQARYDMARDDLARSQELYHDKSISQQQYDAAVSNFEVADATRDLAKIQMANAEIKAPLSGVVLVKAIQPGELATIGTPIVTLADLRLVKLTVYVSEKEYGRAKLGEEVKVSVDSFPREKFSGKVTFVSEKAEFTPKAIQTRDERTTLVYAVKITLPNPELKLKPGMPADAEFAWNTR